MLYSSLVCRLKTQHLALPEIIKHLDEKQLTREPEPGKWSIKDNIAHMVSYQPVFIGRMTQILKGNTPAFNAYKADNEPDFLQARELPLTELMNRLNGNRRQILELITNLPDDELLLKGTHPKFGVMTITNGRNFSCCTRRIICSRYSGWRRGNFAVVRVLTDSIDDCL